MVEGIMGSGLMYQGDDFGQEGYLFVLLHIIGFGGMLYWGDLLLWGCNVGQGHLSRIWHDRLLGAGAGTTLTLVTLWLVLVYTAAAAVILRT